MRRVATISVQEIAGELDAIVRAANIMVITKTTDMEREIKFRAWDNGKRGGSELPPVMHYFSLLGNNQWLSDAWPKMQFLGAKDKNGKEVYEGDIVSGWSDSATVLGERAKQNRHRPCVLEVRWGSPMSDWGGWYLHALTPMERTYPHLRDCTVVGNIYENPEMLEKET